MTTTFLDTKTVELLAKNMHMNETLDMTLFVIQNWTLITVDGGGGKNDHCIEAEDHE